MGLTEIRPVSTPSTKMNQLDDSLLISSATAPLAKLVVERQTIFSIPPPYRKKRMRPAFFSDPLAATAAVEEAKRRRTWQSWPLIAGTPRRARQSVTRVERLVEKKGHEQQKQQQQQQKTTTTTKRPTRRKPM